MAAQRIAVIDPPDPEQVAEAAAAVAGGRLVVLPTETVYGLAVRPQDTAAVERVRRLKERAEDTPFTWHLAGKEDACRLAGHVPERLLPLLDRYWPGPLTVVLPGREGGSVGLRVPAQPFTQAVLRELGEPLWMTSVNASGDEPLCHPKEIEARFGDRVDLVYDAGPSPLGTASTVVRCTGPRLEILREGILSAEEVLVTAARTILFVCTGNTCRSPMAEALGRKQAAETLAVPESELLAHGLRFVSAGVATLPGMPPSEGAEAAAAELGLDLSAHRTRALDPAEAASADQVFCLSASHRDRLAELDPELAARAELLRTDGKDIPDPFGGDLTAYRAARDAIDEAIRARMPTWLEPLGKA